ncbi:hypothetical protein [Paenibacillus sp. DCT19]|uniref:hypothetical protein n=1 Tax=Paenibacillus sp. DCT19 TaxID=2211212 RepID=UPI00157FAB3D|nr:hypothetical protein [Paenibacillus sp. DCT19]
MKQKQRITTITERRWSLGQTFPRNSCGKSCRFPWEEPTGHHWFPLVAFLKANDIQVVIVNPHHVNKSKESNERK